MRTRRVAMLVLLSFLWLQLTGCAPHAEGHSDAVVYQVSTHDGHCHHQTDPHEHDYFLTVPSRLDNVDASPAVPLIDSAVAQPHEPVSQANDQPRCRSGRAVLLDLSIART